MVVFAYLLTYFWLNCKSSSLGNSKYLLAIVWLSVLIGASVSNSFQRVSASTEREACVTELVPLQGNLDVPIGELCL